MKTIASLTVKDPQNIQGPSHISTLIFATLRYNLNSYTKEPEMK